MKQDKFGQVTLTSDDLFNLLYKDPDLDLNKFSIQDPEKFNDSAKKLHYTDIKLAKQSIYTGSLLEFDSICQTSWFMPDEYKTFDIRQWLLQQCQQPEQKDRVEKEILLFEERNLLPLLRYLKYFVDTMRSNQIVWGVGRGSSVASYVLYLIGIHRIDSLKFCLDVEEFLK